MGLINQANLASREGRSGGPQVAQGATQSHSSIGMRDHAEAPQLWFVRCQLTTGAQHCRTSCRMLFAFLIWYFLSPNPTLTDSESDTPERLGLVSCPIPISCHFSNPECDPLPGNITGMLFNNPTHVVDAITHLSHLNELSHRLAYPWLIALYYHRYFSDAVLTTLRVRCAESRPWVCRPLPRDRDFR